MGIFRDKNFTSQCAETTLLIASCYTCVPHTSHHIWGRSPPHCYPSLSLLLPLMLSRWPFLSANPHQKALITAASPQTSPYPIINTADWPADHINRRRQLACDSVRASICSFLMVMIISWNMACKNPKKRKQKTVKTTAHNLNKPPIRPNRAVTKPSLLPEMLWHRLTLLSGCSVKSPWLEYLPFNL